MATPPHQPSGPSGHPADQGSGSGSGPGPPILSFFTLRSPPASSPSPSLSTNSHTRNHSQGQGRGRGRSRSRGRSGHAPVPQISISYSAEVNVDVFKQENGSSNAGTPTSSGFSPLSGFSSSLGALPRFGSVPGPAQGRGQGQFFTPPSLPQGQFMSPGNGRSGIDFGLGMNTNMGMGMGITGRNINTFTPPPIGSRATPGLGSGSIPGPIASHFFNLTPASHARVRGTGTGLPVQFQDPRSFTPQSASPARAGNIKIPSFIAPASSPLGSESPSTPTLIPMSSHGSNLNVAGIEGDALSRESRNRDTETNKVSTLTLAEATHLLNFSTSPTSVDIFPTLSVSVALYSPMGSFLPPLQPLILTSTISLRGLVLILQNQLLANLRHSGSLARLLVQSIQVRVFEMEGLEGLEMPRIEGLLSGDCEVGEKKVVGKTKWIAWDATGGEGESERFWGALLRKLFVDILRKGDEESGGKAPMLKVRTVVKVSDLVEGEEVMGEKIAGGGHIFRVPAGAVRLSPTAVATTIITPRGSIANQGGKGPEDQAEVVEEKTTPKRRIDDISQASTQKHSRRTSTTTDKVISSASARASSSQSTAPRHKPAKTHKYTKSKKSNQTKQQQSRNMAPAADGDLDDRFDAAAKILQGLGLSDEAKKIADELKKIKGKIDPPSIEANKQSEKDHYERLMSNCDSRQVWVEKGGYPKDTPVDPDNNWEKYQTWGEKPTDPGYEKRKAIHEAFSLRHVPFDGPPCKPWGKKDGDDSDGEDEEEESTTPVQMVPYVELDPEVIKEKLLEERNKPENLPAHIKKYWEEQEKIKGMCEIDDDTFFPAANPDVIKKEEATKVFAAKEFKNPGRAKFDIRSVLSGATERRTSYNSAYLESLVADGPSNLYENMPNTGTFQFGTNTTFNQSHAAANNTFQSSLQNISPFSALAKQNYKPASPGPGFYELSQGVTSHTPLKDADSFISSLHSEAPQNFAGENKGYAVAGTSFGDFNSMANDYAGQDNAGTYEDFGAMADEQDVASGYNMMEGNITDARNNLAPSSFDFGSGSTLAGGPSDFRGLVSHGIHQPAGFPNQQGWTSMNTVGSTYNSFGGQSGSFNPRTMANATNNRTTASFTQYTQLGLPTSTPVGRMQSRFFTPMDSSRTAPGNERFAFNNMAVPSNSSHPAPGSFVNTSPATNPNHPAAGSFVHGIGSSRSRTHGLHVNSNPPALSRVRRPIPIMTPASVLTASAPAFQLPSPTRQAIGYGAGPAASLGSGTSGNVPAVARRTPSPEKKAFQKASMDALSAAIATAFNGPKGSPSSGSKA